MNTNERIQLEKMIKANDAVNNTQKIRDLKHSKKIYDDANKLIVLKKKYANLYKNNLDSFQKICVEECQFLFNTYTDIFNKIIKNEIDMNLLLQLINILANIENANVDQHEASFEVGKLLKKIYIDSALKKSENLDKKYQDENEEEKVLKPTSNISWAEYKKQNNL
tara:strand:- start:5134 stop:5631 length:498 start_codon:yes stop_codon:yes gene_type:complete